MAKKDYYMIVDVETTVKDRVADFGAVICDRKGNVITQCAVLLNGIFGVESLFYLQGKDSKEIWSEQGKDRRFDAYNRMLENGTRLLASVAAVNRWLDKAKVQYDPILTAYNLSFDVDKCQKTDIDLSSFDRRFCLWHAAFYKWAHTKKYRYFILENHAFNTPTDLGNMSYKTNAEVMAKFILGIEALENEPHTSIEDIIGFELPILRKLLHSASKEKILQPLPYDWRKVQVKDHFKPR